ncbi:MAG: hypothetical protein ACRDV9_12170 [Acidimicrobiia bacterium]
MRRYLLVANQTLGGYHLVVKVRECMALGECTFHVVVPATRPKAHLTWTRGEARALAQRRLEEALNRFQGLGANVDGSVGDENPMHVIAEALRSGEYDEVLLSTLPPGPSRWLQMDLPHRVERTFNLPVIHVLAESESWEKTRS